MKKKLYLNLLVIGFYYNVSAMNDARNAMDMQQEELLALRRAAEQKVVVEEGLEFSPQQGESGRGTTAEEDRLSGSSATRGMRLQDPSPDQAPQLARFDYAEPDEERGDGFFIEGQNNYVARAAAAHPPLAGLRPVSSSERVYFGTPLGQSRKPSAALDAHGLCNACDAFRQAALVQGNYDPEERNTCISCLNENMFAESEFSWLYDGAWLGYLPFPVDDFIERFRGDDCLDLGAVIDVSAPPYGLIIGTQNAKVKVAVSMARLHKLIDDINAAHNRTGKNVIITNARSVDFAVTVLACWLIDQGWDMDLAIAQAQEGRLSHRAIHPQFYETIQAFHHYQPQRIQQLVDKSHRRAARMQVGDVLQNLGLKDN